ncbi:MAG: Type secretion outer membrane protein, TolC, partial [Proteobacteria bacterium]|nr:Type secretion outer membrane protein, TolC [Pseudomonadota bacterium]
LAYLRTYAGMGTLLEYLGLQKLETRSPEAAELAQTDVSQLCPNDPVDVYAANYDALNARAMERVTVKPAVFTPTVSNVETDITQQVKAWNAAWAGQNYTAYTNFYAPTFVPGRGLKHDEWRQLRRNRIAGRDNLSISMQDMRVRQEGKDKAIVQFRQVYQSKQFSDVTLKTLEMVPVNGKWLINREDSVPCTGNTVGGCKPAK